MNKGVFTEEIVKTIISVPNDQPMHPPLHDPVVPPLCDSPRSPLLAEIDQPASTQAEVPIKFTVDAHRPPISRRSGRQVKKPESVMLLIKDPTGFWIPGCFLGPPRVGQLSLRFR